MTAPRQPTPSVDGNRPRIQRTNSLLFGSVINSPIFGGGSTPVVRRTAGGTFGTSASGRRGAGGTFGSSRRGAGGTFGRPGEVFVPAGELPPAGYELVRAADGGTYWRERGRFGDGNRQPSETTVPDGPVGDRGSTTRNQAGTFLNEVALRTRLGQDGTTIANPTRTPDQDPAIYAPLGDLVDPTATFLFDRGAPLSLDENGAPVRTGILESRGIYASADTLDRQLTPGAETQIGSNENLVTIAAGIQWLRNLASRDRTAYNQLVVLLRNAGYGSLPDDDAALPLGGYTQQVGTAFALAANDLSAAALGGDNRTLMEYLQDRGQAYADYLAQQEAEQGYQPIAREYQDPASLALAAKNAAAAALGRKLTDEEEARFEAAFRSKENAFYDAVDQAGETEGTFSGYRPDTAGQATSFIDSPEFDTERGAELIRQYGEALFQALGT